MFVIKQEMIHRLALALVLIVLFCSITYAGLLTNWFRYKLSLEATFVVVPLVVGAFISILLAVVAYTKGSPKIFFGAVAVALVAAGIVVIVQMHVFGQIPTFFTKHIEKSPVGCLVTPQGDLEYWIELENPFTSAHREYLLVRRGHEQYRVPVPIFDSTQAAFVSPVNVTDWGRLEVTTNPEIFILILGPSLIREGRFQINLAMHKAERIKD